MPVGMWPELAWPALAWPALAWPIYVVTPATPIDITSSRTIGIGIGIGL